MHGTVRQVLIRLTATCAGLGIAVVGAEAVLRLTGRGPIGMVRTASESDFKRIPGIFSPNQVTVSRENPYLPYRVTIDSLGFRGIPFSRKKQRTELRVLMLGDSLTFGAFVEDEETLPAQLEADLQGYCPTARVVNGGLGGSTITDQLALLHRAMTVDPDLVVMEFTENDVADLATRSLFDRLAENRATKSQLPMTILYPLLRESALWNLALQVRDVRLKRHQVPAPAQAGVDSVALMRARYAALFQQLRDSVLSRSIPMWLVTYPNHQVISGSATAEQLHWVATVAQGLNVPVVELLQPLLATGLDDHALYLLPHDGHPSAKGYSVAAAAIAHALGQDLSVRARCGVAGHARTPRSHEDGTVVQDYSNS